MARLWLSVKVVSGCTVLFGSRSINCSQEETFGNLLSRLEEVFFFLLATRVYLSNKTLSRSGLKGLIEDIIFLDGATLDWIPRILAAA